MLAKISLKSLRTMLETAERDPDMQDVLLINLGRAGGITFEQPAKEPGAVSNFYITDKQGNFEAQVFQQYKLF